MPEIILKNVTKRWGNFYAVDDLDLVIDNDAFVTLLGPSGCGKTTTLRMIAGLETPTSGQIIIDNEVVFDSNQGINVPANRRKVGFLFQNYALWPNMTVYQNISFGLKNIKDEFPVYASEIKEWNIIKSILAKPEEIVTIINDSIDIHGKLDKMIAEVKIIDKYDTYINVSKELLYYKLDEAYDLEKRASEIIASLDAKIEQRIAFYQVKGLQIGENFELLKDGINVTKVRRLTKEEIDLKVRRVARIVKIGMFMDRYPNELSGGQQQRVAIARTLAPEPKVLFMDEPLSNLDAKLRLEMRSELQRLHVETNATIVYVTHDQLEAMTLASKICLLDNGLLQQYDAPLTVYEKPVNIFVADFVGNPSINFIDAKGEFLQTKVNLSIWDGKQKLSFKPNKKISYDQWLKDTYKYLEDNQKEYDVDKANKDAPFKYHIQKVDDFETLHVEEELTDSDFVLGIRPEFIKIDPAGKMKGKVYSSMPSGMETIVKIEIDGYILTSVVFGNIDFTIGDDINFDFSSNSIILFNRKNQRFISTGSLE
ncbi:MAG TPA: ABC transporter ATP-binding protein [Acholeplasmataceae bacterium]|nr:ABC transporter ATP-binding protein [Acholeplasmataceae bacterium]HQC30571.1 ABC transporter ATP-binding protein [Acholeplasmataceae bacterium]